MIILAISEKNYGKESSSRPGILLHIQLTILPWFVLQKNRQTVPKIFTQILSKCSCFYFAEESNAMPQFDVSDDK